MSRKPADPVAGAKTRKVRYACTEPSCGHRFTRTTRLGIYSKCPKCGRRVYGPKVHEELAAQHAAGAVNGNGTKPPAKPKAPARTRIAQPASKTPAKTASTAPPPAPKADPPAAPAPRGESLWSRIMGSGDDA